MLGSEVKTVPLTWHQVLQLQYMEAGMVECHKIIALFVSGPFFRVQARKDTVNGYGKKPDPLELPPRPRVRKLASGFVVT